MQALPPQHVYSMTVQNSSTREITVHVVYSMPNTSEKKKAAETVAPNGKTFFEQQLVSSGSAQLTGFIDSVSIDGSSATMSSPFPGVTCPVKNYVVEVYEDAGVLKIRPSA